MKFQEILSRLQNVKRNGNGFTARCPSHQDKENSLSVSETSDKILLNCFAGCETNNIVSALGIGLKDLFNEAKPTKAANDFQSKKIVAVYDYADEHGEILYQNVRYEPKDFRQRKPNGRGDGFDYSLNGARRVPYRLPELVEAVKRGADVWLCEGEKDADNVRTLGLTATNFKNWKPEFNNYLKDSHVCLIQDHDKSGVKQANDAYKLLSGNVASLKTLDLFQDEPLPDKHGKDFSDWLEGEKQNGLSDEEIAEKLCIFVDNADVWQPLDADGADAESTSDFEETESADAVKIGFTFGELQTIELPERVEIVRGLGRGENGLLNAVSHTGKSTLIRNLALCLVLGKPFEPLTAGGNAYRVAIIDSEDTLTFLRSDLNKMQADFSQPEKKLIDENLFLICELSFGDEDLKLNKPEHFRRVIAAINDFGADFVFIDTVTSAFAIRNENDNSEVIENVMHPLKRFGKLTNAGVLTAHHIGKAKLENGETKEGIHRGRGASAFADKSRTIFNLDKDGDERVILSCPKLKGEKFADTIFKYDSMRRLFERQGVTSINRHYLK